METAPRRRPGDTLVPRAVDVIRRTSQHALNVLGSLASDRRDRTSGDELALRTGIPANYLSKILNQLRKRGVVEAEKGRGGGFRLRDEALDLPIREILAIFEGPDRQGEPRCVLGLAECDPQSPCPIHPYGERIRRVREAMLAEVKVRDLARGKR